MLSMPTTCACDRRAEQHGGRMLAGPVVGPGEAALDQPLVDRVQGFLDADHGARRQDLDGHFTVGEITDVFGKVVQHEHFVGLGRNNRLHPDVDRLSQRRRCHQRAGGDACGKTA